MRLGNIRKIMELNRKLIEKKYDLVIIDAERVLSGMTNVCFKASSSKGLIFIKKMLRVNRKALAEEFKFIKYLAVRNIPLIFPLETADLELYLQTGKHIYIIYPFISGLSDEVNKKRLCTIGRLTSQINSVPVISDLPARRSKRLRRDVWIDFLKHCHDKNLTKFFRQEFFPLRKRIEKSNLPKSVIHGDIWPRNFLFDKKGVCRYILDWEDVEIYYRLYEVSLALLGFCFPENKINFELINAFLKGYSKDIKLTKKERAALYDYLLLTILAMMAWRYEVFNIQKIDKRYYNAYLQHREKYGKLKDMKRKTFLSKLRY